MNPSQAQELLQSLPSFHAWGSDLYQYQGFWFFPTHFKGLWSSQNNFQATDTDVLLTTTFKSGTIWLKALLFAITKRSQHPTDDPNHPLLSNNPHELVPFIEDQDDMNPTQLHIPSPRLLSTHSPCNILPDSVKTTKCRIIYLTRDPKDIFISLWHFAKETVRHTDGTSYPFPLDEAFELFCKGINPAGPVWDHALDYWNMSLRDPKKVLFLNYSDLKGDIVSQLKKMADFVGFPFSAEEESRGVIQEIVNLCSFNNLRNLDVNKNGLFTTNVVNENPVLIVKKKDFFRKGEVGDWKNYITPSMRDQLDQVIEQKLLGSGLKFD